MIDKNIPHNILIADEGMTLYIIPRKFDLLIENVTFFTSFETLCGFIKCKIETSYKNMKYEEFYKRISSSVSLKDTEFNQIKEDLITKFLGEYEGERMAWNLIQ